MKQRVENNSWLKVKNFIEQRKNIRGFRFNRE